MTKKYSCTYRFKSVINRYLDSFLYGQRSGIYSAAIATKGSLHAIQKQLHALPFLTLFVETILPEASLAKTSIKSLLTHKCIV